MKRVSMQFHALPEELLAFTKQLMSDYPLHLTAMRYFPFEAIEVPPERIDAIFSADSPREQLAFTVDEPVLPATGTMNFADKNPDKLRLDIQRPTAAGLRQTMLSAATDNPNALAIWKDAAKRLRAMTRAGVVAKNPDTGATGYERTFRYSEGAKALAARGVPMLPIAGGNLIEFPDDPPKTTSKKK